MSHYSFTLPYPPSVNSYWRRGNGRTYINKKGVEYRAAVRETLVTLGIDINTAARLDVRIIAHMPDKRRRDIDNILKAVLDSLEHGGFMQDDSQIDVLKVTRAGSGVVRGGLLCVKVMEIDQ
ncbi:MULTISPECIES: RusA family crossover junction endodeoxyribonuclease [Klebsiella]|uniref:RusA family crossover junction endodeoxyribonuclease n=1 Tax=Klebsiella TaxID=570 RepID=UPI001C242602|nr:MULTISPECIES: RusA family crossover junction endodeoxyribonuclease [Klebsiella]MCD9775849.1 RusA family crossover junction endodeoxyribonuclease [Klebsiella variicola subsp. variicola]QXA73933.1 RusA family crossover junction endodeoxyribonuclease [Klebsiella aerogenes]HCI6019558.1 RusA family crossover junction endodeoxyribonuclease [Klebsiella quasipneumoniae subsp. quasipneumoniae]